MQLYMRIVSNTVKIIQPIESIAEAADKTYTVI